MTETAVIEATSSDLVHVWKQLSRARERVRESERERERERESV
jgi:hypothetical protein